MSNPKYTTLFLLCTILSCTENKGTVHNSTYIDTIPREIRYTADSAAENSRQTPFITNLAKLIGLPAITSGSKDLYIRIWIWDDPVMARVINISKQRTTGSCSIVGWKSRKEDTTQYIVVRQVRNNLQPVAGWDNFFKVLYQYEIPTLTGGQPSIEQKDFLTEMAYVQFEIAQPGQYRYYEYLEPSFYRFIDTGYSRVHEFLTYFDNQMNVDVYHPSERLFAKPRK